MICCASRPRGTDRFPRGGTTPRGSDIVSRMLETIIHSKGLMAYLLVFGLLLASALGFPVPEDISLITGGILIHLHHANAWIMALVCYCGILVGDLLIYRIGWVTGPRLFRRKGFRRLVTSSRLKSIRRNIEERTFITILVARHLFYLRTVTFLVCGAVRVSPTKFIIADSIAALITTPVMLGLGFLFAEHYQLLLAYIEQVKLLLLLIGIAVLAFLGYRFIKQKRNAPSQSK